MLKPQSGWKPLIFSEDLSGLILLFIYSWNYLHVPGQHLNMNRIKFWNILFFWSSSLALLQSPEPVSPCTICAPAKLSASFSSQPSLLLPPDLPVCSVAVLPGPGHRHEAAAAEFGMYSWQAELSLISCSLLRFVLPLPVSSGLTWHPLTIWKPLILFKMLQLLIHILFGNSIVSAPFSQPLQ